MKDIRYRWCPFAFFASSEISAYLEKQAQKGWMIQKPGGTFWKFRRIQPQNLTFSVKYFPEGSDFDPELTQKQQQMVEFCQESGWQLAAAWGQMQIFYTEQPDPNPIETDPVTQVEAICRTIRRTALPSYACTFLLCTWLFVMFAMQLRRDPVKFFSNYLHLIVAAIYLVAGINTLFSVATTLLWVHRAKKQAQHGEFYQFKTMHGKGVLDICFWSIPLIAIFMLIPSGKVLLLFSIAVVGVVMLSGNLVKALLKKKKVSRELNRVVSISVVLVLDAILLLCGSYFIVKGDWLEMHHRPVGQWTEGDWTREVYADAIPLQVQDLQLIPNVEWSTEERRNSTFLVTSTDYYQWPLTTDRTVPELAYKTVQVHVPWLYDFCEQGMLNQHQDQWEGNTLLWTDHFEPIEAAPWGALKAWQRRTDYGLQDMYLLSYPDRLVVLEWELPMDDAQKQMIAQKLGKGEL